MRKDTALSKETVAGLHSTFVVFGEVTPGKVLKQYSPSKAYAKVSCRLVPHQDHHVISKLFADYIRQIAPATVEVKVTAMHGGQGYVCPISLPAYQAAEKGIRNSFRGKSHWQYAEEEVYLLYQLSNRC